MEGTRGLILPAARVVVPVVWDERRAAASAGQVIDWKAIDEHNAAISILQLGQEIRRGHPIRRGHHGEAQKGARPGDQQEKL
jgi:hypothetical protein